VAIVDDNHDRDSDIPAQASIVAPVSGVPDMPPMGWLSAMNLPPPGPQSRVHLMDATDHGWLARHQQSFV